MRISIKTILVLLLCSALGAFAEDDADRVPVEVRTKRNSIRARSLSHVIELTEAHSPLLQRAHGIFEIVRLNYEVAGRQWLPSLDFSTVDGLRGQSPPDTSLPPTPWSSGMDLTVKENFYDNGVSLTNYEIAKDRFERGKIEYEIARDAQLLAAANAFYDWSASTQQRDLLEINSNMLLRQHDALEAQFKKGLKTKRDVLRLDTEIKRLELDILNSDNDIDLGFQKLASVIGMSREALEKEEIEGDEAKTFFKAEDESPELKVKDHRQFKVLAIIEKEAALTARLAQRTNWPQVSIAGAAGYNNHDYLFNSAATTWNATHLYTWNTMLTLTYNIWDWGIRDRQVQIARINEENTVKQNQQILFDLGNDLRNLILQLRSLRANVKMTRNLMVVEQQSYSILEAEYRTGKATYLDLILNLKSLIDARSRFIASYYGYRKQQALYSYQKGDLYTMLLR